MLYTQICKYSVYSISTQLCAFCTSFCTHNTAYILSGAWRKGKQGGVLLIGYESFRSDVNKKQEEDESNLTTHFASIELLVADEGYRLKNYSSEIFKSVTTVATSRKIILTGYPLQNNLSEYYYMINVVRPNALGTIDQFTELFKSPIECGQYTDSNASERKLMNYRSFALSSYLEDFVHREEEVLRSCLPPRYDYVLFLKMTSLQKSLNDVVKLRAENLNGIFVTSKDYQSSGCLS